MNPALGTIVLGAPLEGWATPLAEVPDPVFAQKMLGDGLAIDPTAGDLRAPCAGTVVSLHKALHALTIAADQGPQILLHIGLDTVGLAGSGFQALVTEGQSVRAGEALIAFDLDAVARRARSLLSPMVVTNGERYVIRKAVTGSRINFGDPVLTLLAVENAATSEAGAPSVSESQSRRRVRVGLVHGLHARPAARLAKLASGFEAKLALEKGGRRADVTSPVSVMALGVGRGEEIDIFGQGPQAPSAVDAVAAWLESTEEPTRSPSGDPLPLVQAPRGESRPGVLAGVGAAPGLAIGPAARLRRDVVAAGPARGPPEAERAALEAALLGVGEDLARRGGPGADILAAHRSLLADPELSALAGRAIEAGASAGAAWREATGAVARELAALSDPRLRERIADLTDLERQVLARLAGAPCKVQALPNDAIVVADDILPSELLALDRSRLAGLVTGAGGPTSHVALLAAALDIPAVVALGRAIEDIEDGALLLVDGGAGEVSLSPRGPDLAMARDRISASSRARAAAAREAAAPCRTADGVRIEIFANLGAADEVAGAVALGAEGCGLLRTEFLFLDRGQAPDEAEQTAVYQAVADALGGRPMILRTLDAGADKPLAFLGLATEANPALGIRGIRVGLARPEILEIQIRAALAVRPQPAIMFPMVTSVAELRAARAVAQRLARAVDGRVPRLGVMIETPAAAVTADLLAAEADFLSVGSNDLAQYALAMDRTHPALAPQIDALHPAVLRLIGEAARGGASAGRTVAVCGALASDPLAAPILIGLGITELSASPAAIPGLKARVRTLTLSACAELARRAVACASAADVRALAAAFTNPTEAS